MYDLFNPAPDNIKSLADILPFKISNEISLVPGLTYSQNFISSEEEMKLIDIINSRPWLNDIKRRVQHYGFKYDYKTKGIDYSMFLGPLPNWIAPIAEKLHVEGYFETIPDQVIVNEYLPGQGIANHIDCEPCFGETIVSISLNSSAVMDFIHTTSKKKVEICLEPRSLVSISGDARHKWTHGIPQRKVDTIGSSKIARKIRLSMTFRKVIISH